MSLIIAWQVLGGLRSTLMLRVIAAAVASAVLHNIVIVIMKHHKIKKYIPMLINSIRAMWSIASALCLIFQLPLISFYLFTAGCGSFFINIPVKRMRIKFGRENRIDISLISDQLFIAPILFAFMYCNDPGY